MLAMRKPRANRVSPLFLYSIQANAGKIGPHWKREEFIFLRSHASREIFSGAPLLECFRTYCQPNRVRLTVVGKVNLDQSEWKIDLEPSTSTEA